MRNEPYLASEDSVFLRETLRGYAGERCLEIGAGNAGNLVELRRNFGSVVGTDIIRPSMTDWRQKGANYVLTDGSSCLRDACFDLVAFNPPYLKDAGTGDSTVEGGEGLDLPKKFLREALRVVRPGGKVVMLLSGDADLGEFERELASHGFRMRMVASRRMFFEELSIYEASAAGQVDVERG